jgi:hypothetical protein
MYENVDRIHLAQDAVQRQSLARMVMNLRWRSWVSRKVVDSNPDEVTYFFKVPKPSHGTRAEGFI